jgi:hypothetical protein
MHAESMIAERTKPCIVAVPLVKPCIVSRPVANRFVVKLTSFFAALFILRLRMIFGADDMHQLKGRGRTSESEPDQ